MQACHISATFGTRMQPIRFRKCFRSLRMCSGFEFLSHLDSISRELSGFGISSDVRKIHEISTMCWILVQSLSQNIKISETLQIPFKPPRRVLQISRILQMSFTYVNKTTQHNRTKRKRLIADFIDISKTNLGDVGNPERCS